MVKGRQIYIVVFVVKSGKKKSDFKEEKSWNDLNCYYIYIVTILEALKKCVVCERLVRC